MTSNTTPYGECGGSQSFYPSEPAYYAFDGNDNTVTSANAASNQSDVYYKFTNPIRVRKVKIYVGYTTYKYTVQYSDDGSNWTDSGVSKREQGEFTIPDCGYHIYWRITCYRDATQGFVKTVQFYGRAK